MFIIQAFVNIGGVWGLYLYQAASPQFISYGGSAIMSSILMVGLLICFKAVKASETEYDEQRASWSIAEEQDTFDTPEGFASLTMVDGGVG